MRPTAISTPIEAKRRRMMKAIISRRPSAHRAAFPVSGKCASFAGARSCSPRGSDARASASIHIYRGEDIGVVRALDDMHLFRHAPDQRLLAQRVVSHTIEERDLSSSISSSLSSLTFLFSALTSVPLLAARGRSQAPREASPSGRSGPFVGLACAAAMRRRIARASVHLHPGKDVIIIRALHDVRLLRHAPGQGLLVQRDIGHVVEQGDLPGLLEDVVALLLIGLLQRLLGELVDLRIAIIADVIASAVALLVAAADDVLEDVVALER